MHHGVKNSACKNTPPVKCATLKTSDNASIAAFLPGSGVSVMSPGGPVIDPPPPADLQITASADRFVYSVGALLRERKRKVDAINEVSNSGRYARCIQASKRVRWDMEEDVIRGRRLDATHKFLPDGLSLADEFTTLSADA